MANDTGGNPLKFDATGSVAGTMTIQAIAWVGDQATNENIAADDDMLVTDTGGRRIVGKRAIAAGDDLFVSFPLGLRVDGVKVTALDGGLCFIYTA